MESKFEKSQRLYAEWHEQNLSNFNDYIDNNKESVIATIIDIENCSGNKILHRYGFMIEKMIDAKINYELEDLYKIKKSMLKTLHGDYEETQTK